MRVVQPVGTRGSLMWLQRAVNRMPSVLLPSGWRAVDWLSPLDADDHAEYSDGAMLELTGLRHLRQALDVFWPARGPQWDALGRSGERLVLVEAKAHVREFHCPPCRAGAASGERIATRLRELASALGCDGRADLSRSFYQYANRLAHLWFFRQQGIDAHLLLVNFVGDADMGGPTTPDVWQAVTATAHYAMGLPAKHPLHRHVHAVYPDVRHLG